MYKLGIDVGGDEYRRRHYRRVTEESSQRSNNPTSSDIYDGILGAIGCVLERSQIHRGGNPSGNAWHDPVHKRNSGTKKSGVCCSPAYRSSGSGGDSSHDRLAGRPEKKYCSRENDRRRI